MIIKKETGILFLLIALTAGCKTKQEKTGPPDTGLKGILNISCDESFKPVMDQQVLVYQALYPEAKINIQYKAEAECLKDLLTDSIQMIIATRGANKTEERKVSDSLAIGLEYLTIAHDLIAVITHPSSKDTFFSMSEIRDLLTGKLKENLIPILDGTSATST